MSLLEAVRLALAQIRVQKLKSFFTLAGVTIGVMFLIAVVSIVEGMSRYVENDFIGRILGANTFTLRRFPWFGNNTTRDQWREWQKRPRFYQKDVRAIAAVLPNGTRWAVESQENLWATSSFARPRQVDAHAVEGDYFTIKKYDLSGGRAFTQQEVELGAPVVVIGDEVAKFFFPGLNAVGHELRIGGIPYQVIGVIEHQGSLFGISLDKLVIAPFSSPMHRLTNPRGDIDGLMVQSASELLMNESMEQVREFLRGFRHLRPVEPDNFAMETSATALIQFEKTRSVMTKVGTALPMIGLIVGGMVIMNIMLVAVADRTRYLDRERPRLEVSVPSRGGGTLVDRCRHAAWTNCRHRFRRLSGTSRRIARSHRSATSGVKAHANHESDCARARGRLARDRIDAGEQGARVLDDHGRRGRGVRRRRAVVGRTRHQRELRARRRSGGTDLVLHLSAGNRGVSGV